MRKDISHSKAHFIVDNLVDILVLAEKVFQILGPEYCTDDLSDFLVETFNI